MRTIGLGNALVDVVLRVKDESVLSDIGIAKGAMELIDKDQMIRLRSASTDLSRSVSPGGSVCNTIRAMANLGANVGYIGKIGSDELAQSYESALQQAGVEPNFVKTEGISGSCTVFVTPDGERTMATFLGPAATLNPAELKSEIIRTYDCIYIEGYLIVNEPLFREALSLAKEAGLKVALDLSSFNVVESNLAMLQEVIPAYVDILFCNEQESFSFTGLSPREAAFRLAQMVDIAVVTLGKEGALVATGNEVIPIDAVKALAVDTTGAGDHFAAGFLFGLSKSATLDRAARIGALLASHVVEVSGACIPDHQWEQIKLKVAHILN